MRDFDSLFATLERSTFRGRFRLGAKEAGYLAAKGLPTILQHADDFIRSRLAPAEPKNDGRQTPMQGHPVFVAQHATATCCQDCLAKWHRIERGQALTDAEIEYIVSVIGHWIESQTRDGCEE